MRQHRYYQSALEHRGREWHIRLKRMGKAFGGIWEKPYRILKTFIERWGGMFWLTIKRVNLLCKALARGMVCLLPCLWSLTWTPSSLLSSLAMLACLSSKYPLSCPGISTQARPPARTTISTICSPSWLLISPLTPAQAPCSPWSLWGPPHPPAEVLQPPFIEWLGEDLSVPGAHKLHEGTNCVCMFYIFYYLHLAWCPIPTRCLMPTRCLKLLNEWRN